jgi:hypothetical protein
LAGTIELVQNADLDLKHLVDGILVFTNWWARVEAEISAMEIKVNFAVLCEVRVRIVQGRWEDVKKMYIEYSTRVIFLSIAMLPY